MAIKKKIISKNDGLPVRASGPWIRRKHHFLQKYCEILTSGMKKKWHAVTYLDLFAGPGICFVEDENIELPGSPLLALNYNFSQYAFIENDSEDLKALEQRCKSNSKFKQIQFIEGDSNCNIEKVSTDGLVFAFIDPTGINVHFKTIEKLAKNPSIDLLMNIPFHIDIKRNFKKYVQEQHQKLDLFLGGNIDWDRIQSSRDILEQYKERIKKLDFKTVEYSDIVVNNSQNLPMYFLFFASKHPTGVDFWKKITAKDEKGQREFNF